MKVQNCMAVNPAHHVDQDDQISFLNSPVYPGRELSELDKYPIESSGIDAMDYDHETESNCWYVYIAQCAFSDLEDR